MSDYGISSDGETQDIYNKYPVIAEFMGFLHGSGIDYDWYAEDKGKNIILYNSYHSMDENGFYDYITDFKVIIPKNDIMKFKVQCIGFRYAWNKYMLKEFLYDQIHYGLSESVNKLKDEWPIKSGLREEKIYRIFKVKNNEE